MPPVLDSTVNRRRRPKLARPRRALDAGRILGQCVLVRVRPAAANGRHGRTRIYWVGAERINAMPCTSERRRRHRRSMSRPVRATAAPCSGGGNRSPKLCRRSRRPCPQHAPFMALLKIFVVKMLRRIAIGASANALLDDARREHLRQHDGPQRRASSCTPHRAARRRVRSQSALG